MERMPVFIKIENYEDILDLVDLIKKKIDVAKNTLARISELKEEEDRKLEQWVVNLRTVEDKVHILDDKLGEPQ
jgi:hypothetical protein